MDLSAPFFKDARLEAVARGILNHDDTPLRTALAEGLPLDVPGRDGIRLSHLAMSPADPSMLALLIEAGGDINATTGEGVSLAQLAAGRGDGTADHLQVLLDAGLDVNRVTGSLEVPTLMHAVFGGNLDAAEILLDHGADPNWSSPFEGTAMHVAMITPDLEMARLLLERGTDPRITTKWEPSVPESWCFNANLSPMQPSAKMIAEFESLNALMLRLHGIEFPCYLDGSPRRS
ncbi:ankyrin repeat domain-containing protein [Roseovarius sp. D22-M7]|uniref:ankyrin repeat domain-containing protein n=1 Tax=Roseovarius sp. D22-M7 TaxID=3127116 RepID=UPI00300FBE61